MGIITCADQLDFEFEIGRDYACIEILTFIILLERYQRDCSNSVISEMEDAECSLVCEMLTALLSMNFRCPAFIETYGFSQSMTASLEKLQSLTCKLVDQFRLRHSMALLYEKISANWKPKRDARELVTSGEIIPRFEVRIANAEEIERLDPLSPFVMFEPGSSTHIQPLFEDAAQFGELSDEDMSMALQIARVFLEYRIDRYKSSMNGRNSHIVGVAGSGAQPFIPTPLQKEILLALEGRVLRKQQLADKVCKGDGSRLYRKGGISELREKGLVGLSSQGYYRPDRPPSDMTNS